eukprot:1116137-Prorocentrum_minimum.AAC.1
MKRSCPVPPSPSQLAPLTSLSDDASEFSSYLLFRTPCLTYLGSVSPPQVLAKNVRVARGGLGLAYVRARRVGGVCVGVCAQSVFGPPHHLVREQRVPLLGEPAVQHRRPVPE